MPKAAKPRRRPTAQQILAAEIDRCRDKMGRVTPKAVVAAAKNPNNPLHKRFDWDVQRSAQREWERVAATLIRKVKLTVSYKELRFDVPKWVATPGNTGPTSYTAIPTIIGKKAEARKVLQDEMARIKDAIHRAVKFAVVLKLESEFESLLEQVVTLETAILS